MPADVRGAFENAFGAWKSTWFQGGLAISSVPQNRAVEAEFDALVALGPKVLPLVVEKLLVQFGAGDERILEGEQGRARRVVQAWFANQ